MREAFGKKLVELGGKHSRLFVLDADLNTSTRTVLFMDAFPRRFIQLGIAEQNLVGVAAGLAIEGKIPLVCTFADFLSKRACDQVSISVAYPKVNVKLAGAYPGLFSGKAGATHQSIQDLANMRAMPNMTVVAPCDNVELAQLMDAMMEYDGPVYFRVTRNPLDRIVPGDYRFAWGRGVELKAGRDVTIVGTGIASQWALEAAHELQKAGIDARAIHMPCLKPFDKDLLVQAARETGAIVTVENHSIIGGLGGVAAETLSEEYPVPIQRVGVNDCFVETGDDAELIEKCGLSLVEIMGAARKAMAKKAR